MNIFLSLSWIFLFRPGWSRTHDASVSTSPVLGLQARDTSLATENRILKYLSKVESV